MLIKYRNKQLKKMLEDVEELRKQGLSDDMIECILRAESQYQTDKFFIVLYGLFIIAFMLILISKALF